MIILEGIQILKREILVPLDKEEIGRAIGEEMGMGLKEAIQCIVSDGGRVKELSDKIGISIMI